MGRLFASCRQWIVPHPVAMCIMAAPAAAEVYDKALGDDAPACLMQAPLWVYLLHDLLSLHILLALGVAAFAFVVSGLGRRPAHLAVLSAVSATLSGGFALSMFRKPRQSTS